MKKIKYPKTFHLPWSENLQNDDRMLESTDCFVGKNIVALEKYDGECTTMTRDYIHARSTTEGALTPKQAWSREWVKSLWGSIKHDIHDNLRIHGENMYATHSIKYNNLPSYFLVFAISDEKSFLSYNDVVEWSELLGLEYIKPILHCEWEEEKIKSIWPFISKFGEEP